MLAAPGRAADRLPAGDRAPRVASARAPIAARAICRGFWPSWYTRTRLPAAGPPARSTSTDRRDQAQRPPARGAAVLRDRALPVQLPAGPAGALAGRDAEPPDRHAASTASSSGWASAAAARSPTARTATTAAPACRCACRSRRFEPNRTQRRVAARPRAPRPRFGASSRSTPSTTRCTCATSATATPAAAWTRTAASSTSTSCCTATSRPT